MKKFTKCFFLLVPILAFLSSCKTDDTSDLVPELRGVWNLVNVTCFCPPADLEKDDHVWEFDVMSEQVSVQNNIEKPLQILETGSYEINVTDSTILLKGVNYKYFFREGKLYLSNQPEADGPVLEFEK